MSPSIDSRRSGSFESKKYFRLEKSPKLHLPRATHDLFDENDDANYSRISFRSESELTPQHLRALIFTEAQQYVEECKSKWNAISEERMGRLQRESDLSPSKIIWDLDDDLPVSPISTASLFPVDNGHFEELPIKRNAARRESIKKEPQSNDSDHSKNRENSPRNSESDTEDNSGTQTASMESIKSHQKGSGNISEPNSVERQRETVVVRQQSPVVQPKVEIAKEKDVKFGGFFGQTSAVPTGNIFISPAKIKEENAAPEIKSTKAADLPPLDHPVPLSARQRFTQKYEDYNAKFLAAKSAFPTLENDPNFKLLKSAVLFASSNPITICSANSPMEIIEPYRKAFFFLRGQEIETPSLRICLSNHPEVIHYVRFNMARKFIDLAGKQVEETNEKKLFALATLLTELWACDHGLGDVFLACLYQELPMLVPYDGKSSLKVTGNVELELKKISALTKFYAAIVQTDRSFLLRRLFPNKKFEGKNPHGVEAAWEFLSGILNLEIQVMTTVIVIGSFLRICGWILQRVYGKQFTKMVICISRYVLPKIREKTPKEFIGPVERLASLLEDFHRDQIFPVPANRLSEEFWFAQS